MKAENHKQTTVDTVLADGNRITVTPKSIRGEYETPKLSAFIKFLKSEGFTHYKSGPGDHQIWRRGDGCKVTVNPGHNKQNVDIASLKSLAQLLQRNFGDVDCAIRNG